MKQAIKQYAAKVAIQATREASRFLPKPTELTPVDIEAVKLAFESQWHHFGIVNNWYTQDDLRWKIWDDLAQAKIAEIMKAADAEKTAIVGGFHHVPA